MKSFKNNRNRNRYTFLNIKKLTIKISMGSLLTIGGVAGAFELHKQLKQADICSPEIRAAVQYKSYPTEAYNQFMWAKHPEVKGLLFREMPSSKRDQYLAEWYASQPAIDRCK
jgi:hypothetical protein